MHYITIEVFDLHKDTHQVQLRTNLPPFDEDKMLACEAIAALMERDQDLLQIILNSAALFISHHPDLMESFEEQVSELIIDKSKAE